MGEEVSIRRPSRLMQLLEGSLGNFVGSQLLSVSFVCYAHEEEVSSREVSLAFMQSVLQNIRADVE